MSFTYSIEADPSKALSAVAQVDAANAKVEASAKRVGAAIDAGFSGPALKDSEGRFLATGVAAQKTGSSLDEATAAMKRQTDALENLDSHLQKTTESHAEVAKAAEHPGAVGEHGEHGGVIEGVGSAVAGQFGEVGNVIGDLGTKGTIAAAGIVALGVEVIHLSDEYAQLDNSITRMTGGMTSSRDAVNQQLDLAGTLHSSLEETIELSTTVRERTQDLNLSQGEQLRLTQSLGEMAKLSGHSVQDAAGAFSRLGFAIEEGIPAGRALKQEMQTFPELAEALHEKFKVSGKTIIDMANKGQISMKDFAKAISDAGGEMDAKMGRQAEGLGTKLGHLKDYLFESKLGLEDIADALQPGIVAQNRATAASVEHTNAVKKNTDEIMGNFEAVQHITLGFADLERAQRELDEEMKAGTKIINDNASQYTAAVAKVKAYGVAVDDIRALMAQVKAAGMKDPTKILNAADVKTIRGYADAQQELNDHANRYGDLLTKIHGEETTHARALEDVKGAFAAGVITLAEYNKEMAKLADHTHRAAAGHHELALTLQTNEGLARHKVERGGEGFEGGKLELQIDEAPATDALQKELRSLVEHQQSRAAELYKATASAAEKYADELKEVDTLQKVGSLSGEQAARIQKDIRDRYTEFRTPMEEYARSLDKIKQAEETGLVSTQALEDEMRKLRMTAGLGTFADGMHDAFDKIQKSVGDTASIISSTMVSAFNQINTSLEDMVTTGKMNFTSLGQAFEKMLIDMSLKLIESQILQAFAPSGGGVVGAAVGANAGHATGTQYTVGGSGGTDSSLQAFWASPGERVTVETPEQQASRGSGDGGQPMMGGSTSVHIHTDRRELLSAMDTPEGHRVVHAVIRKNAGAIRSILQK